MALRLSAPCTRRTLLPRNIIIFMFLVLISVHERKDFDALMYVGHLLEYTMKVNTVDSLRFVFSVS
jgi:hypothetical protein